MTEFDAQGSPEAAHQSDVLGLPRAEVRRRSLAGVLYLTSQNLANLLIGFVASLVLARLLTPTDFGVVAIGSTLTLIAGALADGGLGAGMNRRPEPPTRAELRTLNGIQLTLILAFSIPALAVALDFGRTGAVTAIMICSLPITMLQTPGRIVLAREMRYDRQTVIDFTAQTSFQVFAVVTVILGAGVWGLASASIVKALVGTILTAILSIGLNAPSLRGWRGFGDLIRFGLKFQASWFTWIAREQGLNVVVAAVAGVASLGIWTFTNRIFQLPSLAFSSLYAVGFPAMSNVLARGEDAGPIIMRTVRRAAIAGTFVFPAFAAASPELIPSVFGGQWREAVEIMPYVCVSTFILGPIAVVATSYLSAAGRPGIVAWASASLGVVWIGLTAALLPVMGVAAIGVGNLAGALLEAWILDRATLRSAGVAPHRPLLRPLGVGLVAGTAGWLLCTSGPGGFWLGVAAGALTLVLGFVGLSLVCRSDLMDTIRLAGGVVTATVPRLRASSAPRP
jgi:O-antigen/teichoic acid export membrane protein